MRRPNHASRFEGIAKTNLQASRASDTETLQSQVNKAAEKRLSLSGLEILHGRRTTWPANKSKIEIVGIARMRARWAAGARRRRAAPAPDYSGLMLAARMTLPHILVSTLMRIANSSGVLATASKPSVGKRSFTSGSAMIAAISR